MRQVLPIVLAGALTACGMDGDRTGLPGLVIRGPTLEAVSAPPPRPISPENDGIGFAFPTDLRFSGNRLIVLENQNSRIVVFDSMFRAEAWIGSEGAGPGEMRGVSDLDVSDDLLAVGEINNARISLFGIDGSFRGHVPVPDGAAPFAIVPDGGLLIRSASPDFYFYHVDRTGRQRPFADRPVHLYPAVLQREAARRPARALVSVGGDGGVFVLDREMSALLRYDAAGVRTGVLALPASLTAALQREEARMRADFGARGPVHEVSVTDMTTAGTHLLVLFPSIDGLFGLLVHWESGTAQHLVWPPGSVERMRRLGGGRGVMHEGLLYRVLGDDVTVFRLDPS